VLQVVHPHLGALAVQALILGDLDRPGARGVDLEAAVLGLGGAGAAVTAQVGTPCLLKPRLR